VLWLALVCAILGAILFAVGLVVYTNGAGVAPANRTADDPTGFKRATSRLEWGDLFGRMPRIFRLLLRKQAERSDRLMTVGSLCVLVSFVAWFTAVFAAVTGLI
jgi:hypothetical protein